MQPESSQARAMQNTLRVNHNILKVTSNGEFNAVFGAFIRLDFRPGVTTAPGSLKVVPRVLSGKGRQGALAAPERI